MPKKRIQVVSGEGPKASKSQQVRDYIAAHPDAKNTEVVAALKAQGVEVKPNYVSVIRNAGKPKPSRVGLTPAAVDTGLKLVAECGSTEAAIKLLELIQQIKQA